MLQLNQKPGKLQSLQYYLINAFKFYELHDESLVRAIFIFVLTISFGSLFVQGTAAKAGGIFINVLALMITALIKLATSIYLVANIKERKGESYSLRECINTVLKNVVKITLVSVVYTIGALIALGLLLAVPGFGIMILALGLFIYILLMFVVCYMVDKNLGIHKAIKWSMELSDGYKGRIFIIILVIFLLLLIPTFIIRALAGYNILASAFALYFESALVTLIMEKLTAHLYYDLEYGKVRLVQDVEE